MDLLEDECMIGRYLRNQLNKRDQPIYEQILIIWTTMYYITDLSFF